MHYYSNAYINRAGLACLLGVYLQRWRGPRARRASWHRYATEDQGGVVGRGRGPHWCQVGVGLPGPVVLANSHAAT